MKIHPNWWSTPIISSCEYLTAVCAGLSKFSRAGVLINCGTKYKSYGKLLISPCSTAFFALARQLKGFGGAMDIRCA